MTAACPECGGYRLAGDPAGLRIDHGAQCTVRASEDARLVADAEMLGGGGWDPREITPTERTLLAVIGVPAERMPERTLVTYVTPGIVRRTWQYPDTGEPVDLDALDTDTGGTPA